MNFDSKPSQSKSYTVREVEGYRDKLYKEFDNTDLPSLDGDTNDTDFEQSDHLDGTNKLKFRHLHKKRDYVDRPWKLSLPTERRPELFAFKSLNLFDGICRIERINLDDEQVVIICEQVDGNPGNRVTNAVEDIAFQVCEQFEINPQDLIWIEHYDTAFEDEHE